MLTCREHTQMSSSLTPAHHTAPSHSRALIGAVHLDRDVAPLPHKTVDATGAHDLADVVVAPPRGAKEVPVRHLTPLDRHVVLILLNRGRVATISL